MTTKLERQTERAIKAAAKLIPDIVFLPPEFRSTAARVQVVTTKPPTKAENAKRIAEADPIGFLIAVMNGQPVPEFVVNDHVDPVEVDIKYHNPSLELRSVCARYLAMVSNQKRDPNAETMKDFDAMVKNAAKGNLSS